MSADAKVWQDDEDRWRACHDGDCKPGARHVGTAYDLLAVIAGVNDCMAPAPITRWVLHVYPDGKAGLRGFTW